MSAKDATAAQKADPVFGLQAVMEDGHNLEHLAANLRDDEQIVFAAIDSWSYAVEFASARLRGTRSVVEVRTWVFARGVRVYARVARSSFLADPHHGCARAAGRPQHTARTWSTWRTSFVTMRR